MDVNECLRVRVGVPLFFVQPQWSIKEVLEACQCAPVKVLRAERWTNVKCLNSGCLTGSEWPSFIREKPGWQQAGSPSAPAPPGPVAAAAGKFPFPIFFPSPLPRLSSIGWEWKDADTQEVRQKSRGKKKSLCLVCPSEFFYIKTV